VLVVAPAALLHLTVPQPDGTLLYELVSGHPDRAPHELVFLLDLTCELRGWPRDTWTVLGVDPQVAASAVLGGWRRGDLLGLRLGGLTAEEALALDRPAMTYVRERLREPLERRLASEPVLLIQLPDRAAVVNVRVERRDRTGDGSLRCSVAE
jgi:hypothetical protein